MFAPDRIARKYSKIIISVLEISPTCAISPYLCIKTNTLFFFYYYTLTRNIEHGCSWNVWSFLPLKGLLHFSLTVGPSFLQFSSILTLTRGGIDAQAQASTPQDGLPSHLKYLSGVPGCHPCFWPTTYQLGPYNSLLQLVTCCTHRDTRNTPTHWLYYKKLDKAAQKFLFLWTGPFHLPSPQMFSPTSKFSKHCIFGIIMEVSSPRHCQLLSPEDIWGTETL